MLTTEWAASASATCLRACLPCVMMPNEIPRVSTDTQYSLFSPCPVCCSRPVGLVWKQQPMGQQSACIRSRRERLKCSHQALAEPRFRGHRSHVYIACRLLGNCCGPCPARCTVVTAKDCGENARRTNESLVSLLVVIIFESRQRRQYIQYSTGHLFIRKRAMTKAG